MANYEHVVKMTNTDAGGVTQSGGVSPAAGLQPTGLQVIYVPMPTSGATGTADDVTVNSADLPQKFRIMAVDILTSTAGAGGSTVTLRSAAAGGGSAYSTAITTASTGRARDALTVTSTAAAASGLFLRRSDRSHVGEAHIYVMPTL